MRLCGNFRPFPRTGNVCSLCCFVVALFWVLAIDVAAQEPSIDFSPTTPAPGTAVRFFAVAGGTLSQAETANLIPSLVPTVSADHKYVLLVDPQSYRRDKNHRFDIDMYLKLSSDSQSAPMRRFLVWEDPTGTFADSLADVTAQISGPSGLDTVTVKLPEHSDDSPNLALLPIDGAYPVAMGSNSTVTLGVKNNLNGLHATLSGGNSDIKVTDDDCSTCWTGLTAELKRSQIAPGASASLVLHLQPNTFQILKRNWAPTAPNSNQGHLTVSITTHSAEGGLDVPQDLPVPIRFTPPPLYLVLCLFLGAIAGVLMRVLLSNPQKDPFSWRTNAFSSY